MMLLAQSMIEGGSLGGLAASIANSLGRVVDVTVFWITSASPQTWLMLIGAAVLVGWFASRR